VYVTSTAPDRWRCNASHTFVLRDAFLASTSANATADCFFVLPLMKVVMTWAISSFGQVRAVFNLCQTLSGVSLRRAWRILCLCFWTREGQVSDRAAKKRT